MAGRIILRVLFALVLLAVVGGLGVYIYNSGVAQGMLASGQAALPQGGAQVAPYANAVPYYYRPWGFGWGFFGWFIPALFGFLIISVLVRMLIFGSMFAHGRGMHGWRGHWHGAEGDQVPPMVAEWHRKMHESSSEPEAKNQS